MMLAIATSLLGAFAVVAEPLVESTVMARPAQSAAAGLTVAAGWESLQLFADAQLCDSKAWEALPTGDPTVAFALRLAVGAADGPFASLASVVEGGAPRVDAALGLRGEQKELAVEIEAVGAGPTVRLLLGWSF